MFEILRDISFSDIESGLNQIFHSEKMINVQVHFFVVQLQLILTETI